MNRTGDVGLLFDQKAQSWNDKYSEHGPLAFRVSVFSALLAARVPPGASVLDFGGGTGAISSALARRGYRMTVCDLSEQMLAVGKRIHADRDIEWRLLPKDWRELPFPAHTFDAVIASSVFEYLDDAGRALRESSRILRPGGKLIFSVPNPAHLSRKMERLLRPLAASLVAAPLLRAPKIGAYIAYLRVSQTRLSQEQWRRQAGAANLSPLEIHPAETRGAPDKAMLYLVFERKSA
jgi:ubiquinone/menaquinone biosynthesis C-methylase UbiE